MSQERSVKDVSGLYMKGSGGEGGIRTLDTGVSPYNGLANRRLQPLGHLSGVRSSSLPRCGRGAVHAFATSQLGRL